MSALVCRKTTSGTPREAFKKLNALSQTLTEMPESCIVVLTQR